MLVFRNLPPSGFPHCEFIDCGYFIHAVAKTASVYDDVVVKLPVMILAGEDADMELDDDVPFEAGLNLLVRKMLKMYPFINALSSIDSTS